VKVRLSKILFTCQIWRFSFNIKYHIEEEVDREVWDEIVSFGEYYKSASDLEQVFLDYIYTDGCRELVKEHAEVFGEDDKYIKLENEAIELIEKWKNKGYYMVEKV